MAFQTSTLQALADGDWQGHLTVGELRRRGDLGLGTCDALDGEMTMLDGQAWRARADGSIVRVADEERAPFAVATAFAADATLTIRRQAEHAELLWAIKAVADEVDASFAIRFDGAFDAVRARSVALQYLPDRDRSVVAATQQGHFTLGPAVGTLVGFSFPSGPSRARYAQIRHADHTVGRAPTRRTAVDVMDEPIDTKTLPAQRDAVAPDGSDVRVLLEVGGGGMAHFELGPGETAVAIKHRTVEEIWYFLTGRGQMWRLAADGQESVVDVGPGVSISIPLGTTFQFRSFGFEPLSAIGATMPPWPGAGEAIRAAGPWTPTVAGGES